MLKRWAAWQPGIRWLVGIAAVVLASAIVSALFVLVPEWLARHEVGSAAPALVQTARDAARGRLLTLGAGLLAAGVLVFTARNFILSREGQVTDRYTKAVEQLGHEKLDVCIGGIYALERVARDSAKDHPTVMEVLTAFIREHSREQWPPPDSGDPDQQRLTRPDVQAAVTVVGRRDAKRDIRRIDLAGAVLTGAYLGGAHLARANLTDAVLDGANLYIAHLDGAVLHGAHLDGANLYIAYLDGAYFNGAHLDGANLDGAHLDGANLTDAVLTRARIGGADLTDANLTAAVLTRTVLTRTVLTRAVLTGAVLTGANLTGAVLTGARIGGADLTDANLTAANLTAAVLTRANLTRADLTRAELTAADLTRAELTGARWPEGARVPEGWTVDPDSGRLKRAGQLSEVTAHYF